MATDQEPKTPPVNADDLATVLAFMTIEIVAALYPPESSPEQTLTDIANRLLEGADVAVIPQRRAMLKAIASRLIATEDSGM